MSREITKKLEVQWAVLNQEVYGLYFVQRNKAIHKYINKYIHI